MIKQISNFLKKMFNRDISVSPTVKIDRDKKKLKEVGFRFRLRF